MISLNCPHCAAPFLSAATPINQDPDRLMQAWRSIAVRVPICTCSTCDASFRITGGPSDSVTLTDVSKPSIESINVASAPRTGGTAVFIQGKSLDVGNLIVRFGGVAASQVDQRTPTSARVVTPPACYTLNVSEVCATLVLTPVLGSFSVGETVTASNGSTGIVRRIAGAQHSIYFASLPDGLSALTGVNLSGNSGAVATVNSVTAAPFQIGESVAGLTSAAVAVVQSVAPLVVRAPTGGFVANELVRGATSGSVVRLAPDIPYSGAVTVTVENEHGQRSSGAALVGAFSYA